jgi:hypothetical protein
VRVVLDYVTVKKAKAKTKKAIKTVKKAQAAKNKQKKKAKT